MCQSDSPVEGDTAPSVGSLRTDQGEPSRPRSSLPHSERLNLPTARFPPEIACEVTTSWKHWERDVLLRLEP